MDVIIISFILLAIAKAVLKYRSDSRKQKIKELKYKKYQDYLKNNKN